MQNFFVYQKSAKQLFFINTLDITYQDRNRIQNWWTKDMSNPDSDLDPQHCAVKLENTLTEHGSVFPTKGHEGQQLKYMPFTL